jgi:hypothetical protein
MAGAFAYRCERCGEIHEGSPSFGFDAPDHYAHLTDEQKASYGWITDDLCKSHLKDIRIISSARFSRFPSMV